ncbi:MAG: GxxExxY protein [Blastocatellia bacterium]
MPIACREQLRPLSREMFSPLSYTIFRDALAVRSELGRFFDEKHYIRALALQRDDLSLEVPVCVSHQTFEKMYFLDALVAAGAILEFKATESLIPRHRTQLLHYQMLTGLSCGLLINLRPEKITREYVNCLISPADRRNFHVTISEWTMDLPGAKSFYSILTSLLQDWGNCLELALYEEALTHFLGGEAEVVHPVRVHIDGTDLGHQAFRLAAKHIAFKLTAFDNETSQERFASHAQSLLRHTELKALLWANLARHNVTFRSLKA